MICLFHPKTKRDIVIERNGDYVIDKYVTRSLITEKIDGTYEFNFTMLNSADYKLLNLVCKGSIVKTNDEHGDEIFRIESVKKDKKYIEVYARQITIDETLGLWLEDVRPTNLNGQAALSYLVDNAVGETELIVSSDIAKNNTAYYVRKNMYEALACEDTAFLNRWGGEIKRRGYTLYINSRIGMDKGFTIESRKNLLGFNIKEENTVITAIKPMGFDGISADIVYSKYKDDYPRLYVKEIKWEDVKLKSEEEPDGYATLAEAQAELKKRAEKEFAENKIDLIQATYEIDFIELAKTEEYKNIKNVQSASIGDDVTVWIDTYGLELKARVTERQYSPTLDRRIKTTLSTKINTTVPPKPSDILQQIQQQLPPNKLPTLENYIDSMITSGFKNSYYISRPNEALWLDNPDINKAINVVRMNKNGLGFSQNGYYGKYVYGFTIDGKINADLITVGQLNGALIKAGTLTADKIEVSFKDDIKDQIQGDISDSIIPTIKDEVTGEITNQVLKDYVTKSEFIVDKNGLTNKIEGVREEITTKVTEIGEDTNNKIKEVNNSISRIDTKFSTANGRIEQQVKAQSQTIQNVYNEVEGQEKQLTETNKILSETKSSLTTDLEGVKANVKVVSKTTGTISTKLDDVNKNLNEKINSTLDSAKNYTNTELKSVKEKVTTNESSLKVLKNEINSKVGQKEIEKVVSDIKLGGRNLALNTKDIFQKSNHQFRGGENEILYIGDCKKVMLTDLKVGDEITIRLLYRYRNIVPNGREWATVVIQGEGNRTGWTSGVFPPSEKRNIRKDGDWELVYTATITEEHLKNDYFIPSIRHDFVKSGDVYLKCFKVEKGNKVSDWSPAPEDTRQLVTDNINVVTNKISDVSSELKQTKEGFEASVKGINETTKTITTRVENVNASLTNKINTDVKNAKDFATKQSDNTLRNANFFTNAEIGQVNKNVSAIENSLKILKNEINSKMSKKEVDETITNIKLGGRNLALNTKDVYQKSDHQFKGLDNEVVYIGDCRKVMLSDLKVGDKITVRLLYRYRNIVPNGREWANITIVGYGNRTGWTSGAFPPSEKRNIRKDGDLEWIYTATITEEHLKNEYFIPSIRHDFVKSGDVYLKCFKVEKGNKVSDWSPAPEDTRQLVTDNINVVNKRITDVSSEFTQTTNGFKTQVSELTETTKKINENVTALNKKTEEYKSSIEQTQKNIKLEVSKKVDGNKIVSTINQEAEKVKIKASKIQLEGATTIGENGRKITIDQANYKLYENDSEKGFLGFRDFEGDYLAPKLSLSAQGFNEKDSWFTIVSYLKDNNPNHYNQPYIDMAYKCVNSSYTDFSNIKMYNDGNIRISPLKNLEITTNFNGWKYGGVGERKIAEFRSEGKSEFDGTIIVDSVTNRTNGYGLILGDYNRGDKDSTVVRVHTDSDKNKFFRPLIANGDIELGSSGFRWKGVYTVNSPNASSDIRLKENINYIKDKQTLKNWGMDCILEEKDLYNFVKDELNLTTYNFTDDKELQIGFLAQDIEKSKVGSKIVTKDLEGKENYLSYNTGNYTSVLAGALKEAINKIEKLEQEIQELKSAIIK